MLVSIITVCLNNRNYIPFAIESVLNQTYKEIEYIIIDGGSTDGTIDIIKTYGEKISKFVSEPDLGIYDAMNKGLKLATGSIVGLLNSDDLFIDNQVISEVVENFRQSACDVLFGDLYYVEQNNPDRIVRKWETGNYVPGSFKRGWHPPHPTFYVAKHLYDQYGYFDKDFKLAADFELMLRFLEKYHANSCYIPKPLVRMRLGGATSKNLRNIINQNIECFKAFKKNNIAISILYPFFRILPKFAQFFK